MHMELGRSRLEHIELGMDWRFQLPTCAHSTRLMVCRSSQMMLLGSKCCATSRCTVLTLYRPALVRFPTPAGC